MAALVAAALGGALAVYEADRPSIRSAFASGEQTPSSVVINAPPSTFAQPTDPITTPPPVSPTDLAASFNEMANATSATIGIVVIPLGSDEPFLRLGDWSSVGPAWSTIKVPLAIAALRHQSSDQSLISAAITQSDNAAAEQIWTDLGEPPAAAAEVEAVLSETGDPTPVETERIRPGFSAFGQTRWPLVDQAGFLAAAVCDSRNEAVIELMRNVVADQRWGLGSLPGAAFKGGWGPSPDGAYLVRQFGVINTASGRAIVAVAATAASGSFDDGTNALTAVADWLAANSESIPGGDCG